MLRLSDRRRSAPVTCVELDGAGIAMVIQTVLAKRILVASLALSALLTSSAGAPPNACIDVAPLVNPTSREGMVWIAAATTTLGASAFFPEERPPRTVNVAGFWIDAHAVTNAEFAAFVAATGYVTVAEREGPGQGGGAVFTAPARVVDRADLRQWWRIAPDANWRRPQGAGSTIEGKEHFPVVQIAFEDALAYAEWRGRDLPTEAEWEHAARGGLEGRAYVWGDEARPDGRHMANHWQGEFPYRDSGEDGYAGLAPVGCFPANGYGLYDMAGNVWEWTREPWKGHGLRVIKGGSFLCADNYCLRYRPAARQPGDEGFSTEHLGFRTVSRTPPAPTDLSVSR